MKRFLLVFIITLFSLPVFAANIDLLQVNNAQNSFKNGDYTKAIEIYETLIKVEKINNPNLYYNLANIYYRISDLGNAILNMEKAYRLAPRDKDIQKNRQYFDGLIEKDVDANFTELVTSWFSLNEITTLEVIIVILLLLSLSVLLFKKLSFLKATIIMLLVFLVPVSVLLGLKINVENQATDVVLVDSITRSGPAESNEELFDLKAGKIVKVISANEQWSNISFVQNKETLTGWILNTRLGKI